MSILFAILKVIGIILLVILGIILFIILMLLFHPVFYNVSGQAEEDIKLSGHVNWLLGIFWFSYEIVGQDLFYVMRVFGIPIARRPSKKKKKPVTPDEVLDEVESLDENARKGPDGTAAEESAPNNTAPADAVPEDLSETALADTSRGKPPHLNIPDQKKDRHLFHKHSSKRTNPAVRWITMFERARMEWQDEKNRDAFSHLFREMKYLLRHMKPKDIHADITFSAGDPALSGQILGLISLFPLIYQYKIHICPDFLADDWYVRGTFKIRGHLMFIYLCISLLRMMKDKNIRRLWKKIRN